MKLRLFIMSAFCLSSSILLGNNLDILRNILTPKFLRSSSSNSRPNHWNPIVLDHDIIKNKVKIFINFSILNKSLNKLSLTKITSGNSLRAKIGYLGNNLDITMNNDYLFIYNHKDSNFVCHPPTKLKLKAKVKNFNNAEIKTINNTIEITLDRA